MSREPGRRLRAVRGERLENLPLEVRNTPEVGA